MRVQVRPPLSLGRELYWREESQVFHWVPVLSGRLGDGSVLGLYGVSSQRLYYQRRSHLVGLYQEFVRVQPLGGVYASQLSVPLKLGFLPCGVPDVPGGHPGHDNKREDEPGAVQAFPQGAQGRIQVTI